MILRFSALASGYLATNYNNYLILYHLIKVCDQIPICRKSQIRDFLEIVKAFQVWECLFGMPHKVRQQTVNMSSTHDNVIEHNVQIYRKVIALLRTFKTEPSETQIGLMKYVI
jgi:hypothetical protein